MESYAKKALPEIPKTDLVNTKLANTNNFKINKMRHSLGDEPTTTIKGGKGESR